ncbi:putative disease resistance protein At3g14460 [Punica granatum]|uniref:Uncharacterized protein n=2 Tax=Punica granatum TaxID=22663 RepID=A0A218Y1E7_PUNGR|nr:putative disease resistance protein At3g14460 [Punica granatum]OWM90696.1 hypothetical protein CDL15_Pgr021001 [Punica granatum]PKI54865.1 hypothetical protein CRG98_024748 [Punica granatum]
MPMERALESASVSWLINHLASQQVVDFLLKWEIDSALTKKLNTLLLSITAVLNSAEDRQVDDPHVRAWLDDLRDAVYEAEDLIDEIATRALESELGTGKLTGSLHLSDSVKKAVDFKLKDVVDHLSPFKVPIESKIRGVVDRLEDISRQKDILRLTAEASNAKLKSPGSAGGSLRLTTPAVTESRVHGRDADKEAIKRLLVSGLDELSVIPIVGMGGIGKTTLAKIVYNDEDVKGAFDSRAWAYVSDVFDSAGILRALVESATREICNTNNLELLQCRLQSLLSKKKFLVVLDDVWNDEYGRWDDLRTAFENVGAAGSRIIVTTRSEEVARIMRTGPTYHLKGLLEDASWSLFEQIAFPKMDSAKYPNLRLIGREIVLKCKGLPLAVKVIGGSLLQNTDENYWRDIARSKFWDLPGKEIVPALRLSYYHLPPHLKKCFAYCSMFPKGYEFDEEMLVLLWLAEGVVQLPGAKHDKLEEEAAKFFTDLVSRSFFQHYSGEDSTFVVHDLIHELAQSVSGKASLSMGNKAENSKNYDSLEKTRHLSYIRGLNDAFLKFEPFGRTKSLRTFLPLDPFHGYRRSSLTKKVVHELLPNLSVLRVLSLQSYEITSIPGSIGNLKHLRYLNLSHSLIQELPHSVNSLYNLQTLILNGCKNLMKLPDDIGSLINLRHLILNKTNLQMMPMGMRKLANLRSLTNFVVGDGCGSGIGELRDLSLLRGKLHVSGLHNVKEVRDAIEAKLNSKKDIDELVLEWDGTSDGLRDIGVETDILDALEPNESLRRLTIRYYGSPEFPSWLGDPSFDKMVSVHLYGCRKCRFLPPLGMLPGLENLVIEGMDCIKSVGLEFYGDAYIGQDPFPSLKALKFEDMKEWEEWLSYGDDGVKGFPRLYELSVFRCPKLGKFSGRFGSLEILRIKNCAALTSFSECSTVETSNFAEYPHLRTLVLHNCIELNNLPATIPSLESLSIDNCERLTHLPSFGMLKKLSLFGSSMEVIGNLVDLTSLTSLEIRGILHLKNFPEGFLRKSRKLEELNVLTCNDLIGLSDDGTGLNHLSSLKKLTISACSFFKSLPDETRCLPPVLTSLDLKHCENLTKLPSELFGILSLRELKVERCPQLEAFPESGLPPLLKRLEVRDCPAFKIFPGEILDKNVALEYLELRSCSSLVSFLENGRLPTTLRHIKVAYCKKLQSLPQGIMCRNDMALEYLEIDSCSSLVSFPSGELPGALKKLEISHCTALTSLPVNLVSLRNLDTLVLTGCPAVKGFPRGGLPTNLVSLRVSECEELNALLERIDKLKCLQVLDILNCPSLELIPRQGLPTSLISLSIQDCPKLNPVDQWKLHKLVSLKHFSIGCCKGLISFPSKYLLPDSITLLDIVDLPDLESLSPGLENLTSLENLAISGCSKLRSLPENGLPPSLGSLAIRQCPLLKEQCETSKGAEWSKVENVPYVILM